MTYPNPHKVGALVRTLNAPGGGTWSHDGITVHVRPAADSYLDPHPGGAGKRHAKSYRRKGWPLYWDLGPAKGPNNCLPVRHGTDTAYAIIGAHFDPDA